MRRLVLLVLCLAMAASQLWAQATKTVTGTVTDDKGLPLAGATVSARGTNAKTITAADGRFSITVPQSTSRLQITYVGFTTQEVAISGGSVNVKMSASDAADLTEVVVTGYGREKKSGFTGASTQISGAAVGSVPVGAFDQALQGRAPGVLVNSGSGQPGSSANIIIRGIRSIQGAGAQPLFVLDGVPMPSFDMQTINPDDFESITVLKDASASAMYGARGGTGVIVLTSKRGKEGPTRITYKSQFGITQRPNFDRLNIMNTSEILAYEEMTGAVPGGASSTPGWTYSPKNPANAALPATSPAGTPYAPSQARYAAILDSIRGIDMNWGDVLFRQGFSQRHELSLTGGSERTRFYLSGEYFSQEGIDLGSKLDRYTTRINLDHTANKLSIGLQSSIGYSKTNLSEGEWLGNSPRDPFQMIYRAKPYENPYKADGTLNFGTSTSLSLKQIANLLEGIQNSQWTQNQVKVHAGINLGYKIVPGVTLKNTFGIDVASDLYQHFIQPGSYYGSLVTYNSGEDRETYNIRSQLINTTGAVFEKRIKQVHEVEAGAYFEVVRTWSRAMGFTLYNLDPRLGATGQGAGTLPVTPAPQNSTSARSGYGIRSYFATAKYTYNSRYSINANVRRDGTSRIVNPDNQEVTTWSAGATWNAIKENFMANQRILTDLKVRASYGIVPNIGSISTTSYTIGGGIISLANYQGPQLQTYTTTGGGYAGSGVTGIVPATPGNSNYRIEKVKQANIGLDFALWKNRARFTVDFYRNLTVDLFARQNLSATAGFATLDINAGKMENKGFELAINVDVVKKRDFTFSLGLNHAYNENKITDLGGVPEYFLGTFLIKTGLPYGSHYTYNYLGADPATGKPVFETPDGKTTTDVAQAGQFAKFGSYLPKHTGGFTADVTYQRFSLSALFSYQFNVVRSDNTRNWITRGVPGYYTAVNQSREMLTEQWMKPGDVKFYQSPAYDRGFTSSDLQNAKFLRFRNLMLAYNLPQINAGKTNLIKGGRFYVQGQNLAIWSPWKGIDPEDNNNISLNEYPNPKMFVVGLDINF